MPYTPTTWIDRSIEFPHRYEDELGNIKTFTPSPGTVTEAGTAVNATAMNNIEAELARLKIASGTFSDTTTVVAINSTYTKTIPLGFNAKQGNIHGYATGNIDKILIHFTTNLNDGVGTTGINGSYDYTYNTGRDGAAIFLVSNKINVHIVGSNLVIDFINVSTSATWTLNIEYLLWQVEG